MPLVLPLVAGSVVTGPVLVCGPLVPGSLEASLVGPALVGVSLVGAPLVVSLPSLSAWVEAPPVLVSVSSMNSGFSPVHAANITADTSAFRGSNA
jgi:hypothetical protein